MVEICEPIESIEKIISYKHPLSIFPKETTGKLLYNNIIIIYLWGKYLSGSSILIRFSYLVYYLIYYMYVYCDYFWFYEPNLNFSKKISVSKKISAMF